MVRRALTLFRAVLAVVGCGFLVLLYFLAGEPSGLTATWLPASIPGSGPGPAPGRLLSFLRRPMDNTSHETGVPPGYLVFSPSCRIPDTDPYHPSLRKLVQREEPVVCSALPPLTTTRLAGRMHILALDKDLLPKYTPRFYHNVTCCFQSVTRIDPEPLATIEKNVDNKYNMGRCEDLVGEAQLEPQVEFVMVRCSASRPGGRSKKVYTNMHAVVAPKAAVRAKLRGQPSRTPGDPRLSVLIVGVDSVSRLNYFRTMPRTSDLLRAHGWYELRGYNKIDDNTFPNLMAILTGMTRPQVEAACFQTAMTPMDDCPILWRNFSREGYVTAYVEDEPTIGTFNYQKAGFASAPTDYYLRPFMLAAQEHLEVRRLHRLSACLGPTTAAEHILSFAASMATILQDQLYFALFWMNSFSHNSVNSPSAMDERLFHFWRDLHHSGALRNTLVLFLSDHGTRFGKIRETEVGWLEERLPFINIWLPEGFRARYPDLERGLRVNENRLTTPWDVHVTLRDVLRAPWDGGGPVTAGSGCTACPHCVSLFTPVPANRSCGDVAVDDHWCTCYEYASLSTEDQTARGAALHVVRFITDKLTAAGVSKPEGPEPAAPSPGAGEPAARKLTNAGWHCAPLSLQRVKTVRSRQVEGNLRNLIITLETVPGHALFEATVQLSQLARKVGDKAAVNYHLLGSISRINEFWEHSQCIHSADLKKYCHCARDKRGPGRGRRANG